MGAGKSTAGKKLAERLKYRFIDTDLLIEERAGMPITGIFSEKGEAYFRNAEHEVLTELSGYNEDLIVSTGGGAPCFMDNMQILNSSGITVYLKIDPEELFVRLTRTRVKDRPLISDKSPEELLSYINNKLSEREEFYNQSKIIIDGKRVDLSILEKRIREYRG